MRELTAEGALVLDYARRVLSEVDGLRDELDAIFTAVDPDALGDEFAATLLSEEEFVCALRPIGPEPFTWPVALVWRGRRRQPPAAKAFLALAIARAESAPPVRLVA
jgi:DNA-binding transcriptional LysR family regulator